MRHVAIVGPLPPPLHGFSSVTSTMRSLVERRRATGVFDRGRRVSGLRWLAEQLLLIIRFFMASCLKRQLTVYLGLSAGKGQVLDAFYLLISRILQHPQFIHHHNFSYIDSPGLISNTVLRLTRNQTHIVLSQSMGQRLAQRYHLNARSIVILSNAAFLDDPPETPERAGGSQPLRIGFLSNITFEKGFVEFFDVLARLKGLNVSYCAYLAGPVASDARDAFARLHAAAANTEHLGPVYGHAKDRFYRQLDIFLFPTKYANEAEPLVILEALRFGVYVIACGRGAIPEVLSHGAGLALPGDGFADQASQRIHALSLNPRELLQCRRMALEQSRRLRGASLASLESLLDSICSGARSEQADVLRLSAPNWEVDRGAPVASVNLPISMFTPRPSPGHPEKDLVPDDQQ